ncbi:MAG: hypothetical protein ACJATV_000691 [Granulosicoccus sp.]
MDFQENEKEFTNLSEKYDIPGAGISSHGLEARWLVVLPIGK